MEEAILALKDDNDPDVRAYFNPPPSLSTCESTTEYFDSDGEPIGDVSVSLFANLAYLKVKGKLQNINIPLFILPFYNLSKNLIFFTEFTGLKIL